MGYAKKIIEYRKKKKLSQDELAKKLGVSQEQIFSWENNLETPSPDELLKLSRVLGISFNKLLSSTKSSISSDDHTLNISDIFSKHLLENEQTWWTGRSKYPINLQCIPFIFAGGVFAIFFTMFIIIALNSGAYLFIGILPFIMIGVIIAAIFFTTKKQEKKEALYAITNLRVLIINNPDTENILEIQAKEISNIHLFPGRKGTKSIVIQVYPTYSSPRSMPFLFNVEDHKHVMSLLRALKNQRHE